MTPEGQLSFPDGEPADPGVEAALQVLSGGGLVVHPTETVYGIGSSVEGPGVERLRRAKGRSAGGFVVLIPDHGYVGSGLSPVGARLAETFWPGPVTLVCDDAQGRFPPDVKAADGSVAVRVCGHERTRDLVARLGRPMTSTSANRPAERPATELAGALEACEAMRLATFGLDGGVLPGQPPSTIVDVRGSSWSVIRAGAVGLEELREAAGSSGEER